jgi:hypothetical protein
MELNGVTSATPMVLLGLAVATCIHLLMTWQLALRRDGDKMAAMAASIRFNAFPVFLAVSTTIVSFLCLNMADAPPFRDLGNLIALGLTLTGILAFTLLPVLIVLLPAHAAHGRDRMEQAMMRLGGWVLKRQGVLLAMLVCLVAGAAWGVTKVRFDDRFAHYFSERFEFRQDSDFMEARLSGLTVLEYSLPAGAPDGAAAPAYLASMERFTAWLKRQPEVDRTASFADIVRQLVSLAPHIPSENGLPASEDVGRQIIEHYRQATEDKGARYRPLSAAGDHTVFEIVLSNVSARKIRAFADRANGWLKNSEPSIAATANGMPIMTANLSQRNARGMTLGTLAAFIAVSAILLLALRNLRLGVVSLLPNLLPMLVAYGIWGVFAGEVSFAATVVMAMTFGIVVDDTVHVLAKYNRLRRGHGLSLEQAIPETFRTVGVAVTATTVSIASGFAALSFSGFLVNRHLGLLTLLVLFAALSTVLFILPPLLKLFDRA